MGPAACKTFMIDIGPSDIPRPRTIGVLPYRAGRADARFDRQRGIPRGYRGKIRAPGREEGEGRQGGGATGTLRS